jgi:hypothetical protein
MRSGGRAASRAETVHAVSTPLRRGPAGAASVLRLQRAAGNRATTALIQRGRDKKKKVKNPRLRAVLEEQAATYTLPTERKGSKKKSQRAKREHEYEQEMTRFARNILIDSEGNVHVGGHAQGRHAQKTDDYLLGRGIPIASTFDSQDDQVRGVVALLMAYRAELEQWLESDDETFGASIERPDEVQVHGVQRVTGIGPSFNRLGEGSFGHLKAFFRKDSVSAGNPWGLITCYPSQTA